MSSIKIRSAVVGCGKVGHTHAQALQTLPESELVAVCGRDAQRTAAFARKYGVQAYTDLRRMIIEQKVQLINVCTPHPAHAGAVVIAAELGCHALVEKPLAPDLEGCDRAIAAASSHGVRLGVISQRRLYPPVVRMQEAIAAGKIVCRFWRPWNDGLRSPEYYLMDPGAAVGMPKGRGDGQPDRTPDRPVAVADGPVVELFGYWENFNHPSVEVEDTAVAVMRFKSAPSGRFAEQLAETGFLGKDPYSRSNGASVGAQTEAVRPLWRVSRPKSNHPSTTSGLFRRRGLLPAGRRRPADCRRVDTMSHYHRLQIEDMLEAIQNDARRWSAVKKVASRLKYSVAVYRSRRDGAAIKFPLQAEPAGGIMTAGSATALLPARPGERMN